MKLHTFVTDTTDPRERGRLIGERFAPAIRETVALYLAFFPKLGIAPQRAREIGEASLATLGAWCPRLAAEVEAIADGVNLPCWQLACLNARTEILATAPALAEGECSTTVHAPAGPHAPRTLQTWDWHDSLAPQGLLMQIATPHGRTVKLFSEFGMLAKLGVNSAGPGCTSTSCITRATTTAPAYPCTRSRGACSKTRRRCRRRSTSRAPRA